MFATSSQSSQGTTAFWFETKEHYDRLKAITKATGQDTFYITSIENRKTGAVGHRVFEAKAYNAAQRLADGTHNESTPEEIERYKRDGSAEVLRLAKIEESRKNTMTIRSSPEDDGRLAGIVAAAVQAALANKPKGADKEK